MDYLSLLTSLFLAAGCAPLAFFQAACPCCPTGSACTFCDDSGDIGPNTVQVVISGMTNLICTGSNCANLDATYVLTFLTDTGVHCRWTVNAPGTICTRSWTVNVYVSATELKGQIVDGFSLVPIEWQSSAAGFKNCLAWSSFNLPWATNANTQCSGASATFTVTAL